VPHGRPLPRRRRRLRRRRRRPAFLLARAGHRVELFERAPVVGPVGAGILLQPSGLRFYSWVTFALTPFFQSNEPILGWGRDVALPLMTRWRWLRYHMALTMGGVKRGFLGGGWSL
jgi:hypothetical protein